MDSDPVVRYDHRSWRLPLRFTVVRNPPLLGVHGNFSPRRPMIDQGRQNNDRVCRMPLAVASLITLLGVPQLIVADDFSALVTFSSNYFYRGYSKSANTPTVRANADYGLRLGDNGAYLGTWISRVEFGDHRYPDRTDVEFYPYLGAHFKIAEDWRLDTSVSRYIFVGDLFGKTSDYNEYNASLHLSDVASARFAFSDDLYHRGHAAFNYEVSGRYPVTETIEASAGFGYYDAKPTLEYNSLYWNFGFTWFFSYVSMDFRYVDYFSVSAPVRGSPSIALPYVDPKFVFSLSAGW